MAVRQGSLASRGARLFLKRSRAQAGLLATLGLVSCVLSGLLVALGGYLSASATTGARAVLAATAPTASGYRFVVDAADDPAGRQAAGDALVDRGLRGLPATATRLYRSVPLAATAEGAPVVAARDDAALLTLAAGQDLVEHARLVSGAWPSVPGPGTTTPAAAPRDAALQAAAAEALGLRLGDELVLEWEGAGLRLRLSGTWEAADTADPFWFSDPELLTGEGDATADGARVFGPLLLAELPEGPASGSPPPGRLEWTVLPDASRVTAGELSALVAAAGDIQRSFASDPVIAARASVQGELDRTRDRFARAQNAIRGVTPVGLILVALIGAIALGQVSRLLVAARRGDTALLRSRGATTARLLRHASLEALVACGAGAAAGAGLAHLGLLRRYGEADAAGSALAAAGIAVGGIAIVVGVFAGELLRSRTPGGTEASGAGAPGTATPEGSESRTRTVVALSSVVLATAAAGLAIGQSLLYGSPLVTDAAGRESVDPLALLAPALGLVAASLLLLAGATPLARFAEHLTARGRRLQPWFSARQLSRGLARYSAAGLVVALAVGSLTLAASYSGTWSSLGHRTELLRVGADQRLILHEGRPALASSDPVLAAPYRALDGVDAASPALVGRFLLPEGADGVLTALPATELPLVMTDAGGSVALADLARRLPAGAPLGRPLPEGARSVTLHGTLEAVAPNREGPVAPRATVDGTVWLENADGALLASPFGPVELASGERSELDATTRLPEAGGVWRVVAVDVRAAASVFWKVDLRVTGITATDADGAETALPFTGADWTSQLALEGVGSQGMVPSSTFDADAGGFDIGLSLRYGNRSGARAMAVSDAAPLAGKSAYAGTVEPLPIAVSRSLAETSFLEVGEKLGFRLPGLPAEVSCVVAEVLPNIPGAAGSPAILADLLSLNEHLLRTSELVPAAGELWMATAGGPVDASALTGPGVRSTSPGSAGSAAVTATAELALWLAAVGCLLLAALSLGAVVLAVSRARTGEFAALRAEGLRASDQARARLAETLAVGVAAVLAGVLAGGLVSWLTVPNLARSVVLDVPDDLPVPVEPALLPWGAALALLLVAVLAIAVVQSAAVGRAARDAVPGREAR